MERWGGVIRSDDAAVPWPLGALDRAYLSLAGRFKTRNGFKI